MSILNKPYFHNEKAAFAKLEEVLWPNGPVCPHCGSNEKVYVLQGVKNRKGEERLGLKKCGKCRKQFTVRVGTVFESSHIPLHKWFQAVHLLCSSKKGISSHQLHRILEITYKSAWFMSHRIREAMRDGVLATPFGSGGGDVEVDETFIGTDPDAVAQMKSKRKTTWSEKMKVLSLVDRDSGQARSFVVDSLGAKDVAPILAENIAKEARLLTDEAPRYIGHGRKFRAHGSVHHKKEEWVSREDPTVHTQNIESFYSVFKRGMRGVYQHASKRHLHRYMAEFDFRYGNRIARGINDETRSHRALEGIKGKRLTYRGTDRKVLSE